MEKITFTRIPRESTIFVQKKGFINLLGWHIRPRGNVQITRIIEFALHN